MAIADSAGIVSCAPESMWGYFVQYRRYQRALVHSQELSLEGKGSWGQAPWQEGQLLWRASQRVAQICTTIA